MATHSSILAWKIPWTEETGGLESIGGHKELDKTERLNNSNLVCASQVVLVTKHLPASTGDAEDTGLISRLRRSPIKGNGNQFQYSCLENSMDRGDWRAIVRRSTELSDMTEYTHTT